MRVNGRNSRTHGQAILQCCGLGLGRGGHRCREPSGQWRSREACSGLEASAEVQSESPGRHGGDAVEIRRYERFIKGRWRSCSAQSSRKLQITYTKKQRHQYATCPPVWACPESRDTASDTPL